MKNKKDDIWQEQVLNSFQGIQRAVPRENLFNSIELQLEGVKPLSKYRIVWAAAAAIIILAVNAFAVHITYSTEKNTAQVEYSEADLITTNYTLYNE